MLREDYFYASDELKRVISQFKGYSADDYIKITNTRLLSPDSFLWRLRINNKVHYLYAEDHIPSMAHVRKMVAEATNDSLGKFIAVKNPYTFKDHPTANNEPDDWHEISKYLVASGYDSAFLFKISAHTTSKKSISG